MVALTNYFFTCYESLRHVFVIHNSILGAQVFTPLTSLDYLSIGGNNIEMIGAGTFQSLGKLTGLVLGDNEIGILQTHVFSGKIFELCHAKIGFSRLCHRYPADMVHNMLNRS